MEYQWNYRNDCNLRTSSSKKTLFSSSTADIRTRLGRMLLLNVASSTIFFWMPDSPCGHHAGKLDVRKQREESFIEPSTIPPLRHCGPTVCSAPFRQGTVHINVHSCKFSRKYSWEHLQDCPGVCALKRTRWSTWDCSRVGHGAATQHFCTHAGVHRVLRLQPASLHACAPKMCGSITLANQKAPRYGPLTARRRPATAL
eukprot:364260-Chlamydomonas_euryale.AAC.1